jgi:hypothetical protein
VEYGVYRTLTRKEGRDMVTIVLVGYSGNEVFDMKIQRRDISENGFVNDVFQSHDDGKTWLQNYEMTISRSKDIEKISSKC